MATTLTTTADAIEALDEIWEVLRLAGQDGTLRGEAVQDAERGIVGTRALLVELAGHDDEIAR